MSNGLHWPNSAVTSRCSKRERVALGPPGGLCVFAFVFVFALLSITASSLRHGRYCSEGGLAVEAGLCTTGFGCSLILLIIINVFTSLARDGAQPCPPLAQEGQWLVRQDDECIDDD